MNVISVDPGTSHCGIVYASELSVICYKTISGPPIRNDKDKLADRARRITQQILAFMADKPHEMVVIEGYTGGFARRQNAFSHQVPFICGYIIRALEHAGEPYVVQLSSEVLNPRAKGSMVSYEDSANGRNLAKQNALKRSGWRGVENLPNDHTRAAMLHAIYYYNHKGE